MSDTTRVLAPGQGEVIEVVGDRVVVKATAEDTDGAYTVLEVTVQPDAGPPPHIHHREDETFYVLQGTFVFHIGDRRVIANEGSFLQAPRGLPHRFVNVGGHVGRLLVVVKPGGFERFLRELSKVAPGDLPAMQAVARKHGLEFV
jgi:mannose-6-phosphate isomerase-like protein (cupin superfamily)